MIKLTTLNNTIQFHIIGIDEVSNLIKDVYINYINFYNLVKNEDTTITVKKAISENNDKKFKPRNEVIAKIYKEKSTYKIKVGIGKDFKPIQSIENIEEQFIIQLPNYKIYKELVIHDFEKYEIYNELKKQIKQQNANNSKIKKIDF